jgi:hypothetical protein
MLIFFFSLIFILFSKLRENIGNNRYRTRFEKTYAMSTYLAAWAILPDDFGYEEGYTKKGTKVFYFII